MFLKATRACSLAWPIQMWVSVFLALSLFAIPLSSTVKSIFIAVSLCLILFSATYRKDLWITFNQPWCKAGIFFFCIALIACAWSPATLHEKLLEIEKYSKLLYLPVLVVGFRDAYARRLGLHAFLFAMLATFFASVVVSSGLFSLSHIEASGVFRNHIMTGYMMAFAAYLSGFLFFQQHGRARIPYAILGFVFSYDVLFINNGRTGYVVFILLMALLMLQTFTLRQAVIGMLLGCSLMVVTFYESPVMQQAIYRAVDDCKMYKKSEKDTSIGYRLQFHDYAYNLFKRSPWFGNGTTSFKHIYHQENPIPARGTHLLEPHSQYWLVASEFGLLGCLALALFFTLLLVSSWTLTTLRPVALGILLPFLMGNLSDSLLFYSGTGYFFILFMALCLGEQQRKAL